MDNWLDPKPCEEATWDFCKRMREDPTERQKCLTDPAYARKSFAKDRFYLQEDPNRDPNYTPIPQDTEFRVYNEDEKDRRQKLVTIVLPGDGIPLPLPARLIKPAEAVWKGTWFPYPG
jgi:hypothetical protein